jgi:hypothetical protein
MRLLPLAVAALVPCLAAAARAEPVCGAYGQVCCARSRCNAGHECRGSCQPIHKAEAEKPLGARSVRVVLVNQTPFTLRRVGGGASHGVWSSAPPSYVNGNDYAQWQTDSSGLATGTTAHAEYDIWGQERPGGKMVKAGDLQIRWNNPFDGGNDYGQSTTAGFALERVGGSGNHTTIFFFLRPAARLRYECADLWVSNHLHDKPGEALGEFDEAIGFFTTAIKRSGIEGWTYTGCGAAVEAVAVRDAQHSTDGFWTIDVWLTKFRVGAMDGMAKVPKGKGRALRVEVKPGRKAHDVLNDRPDQRPRKGDKIQFRGPVYVDHGHYLEVHPDEPIEIVARGRGR